MMSGRLPIDSYSRPASRSVQRHRADLVGPSSKSLILGFRFITPQLQKCYVQLREAAMTRLRSEPRLRCAAYRTKLTSAERTARQCRRRGVRVEREVGRAFTTRSRIGRP